MSELAAERHKWAVDIMNIASSDRILEIGCGHGHTISMICKHLVEGRITALDQSEKMIQAAKKRNAPFVSLDKVRFLAASIHKADLGNERFDCVCHDGCAGPRSGLGRGWVAGTGDVTGG